MDPIDTYGSHGLKKNNRRKTQNCLLCQILADLMHTTCMCLQLGGCSEYVGKNMLLTSVFHGKLDWQHADMFCFYSVVSPWL